MQKSLSEKIWMAIKYATLILFTIMCLYPILWLLLASFKTNDEL